ncbi:MAG TPA: tetratricopeptide repeat protein [Candidatus Sulfotelmatobacter sp.]|nr:tetratricopeptide repeat protein [Candidatus Sulfotelmatobacter sp.]
MDLTPQQWGNVKELFELALEKTPKERSAFLAGIAPEPAVRNEVERLLAHHVESGGFLSQPVLPTTASALSPKHGPYFVAGEIAAERFRITRFLARGGMGEVYEAEDLELREHVALKSIRGELLDDPRALERFKREVQLARKVTHPNVCRIFDLFRHSGSRSGMARKSVVFVAMELLQGQTLADLLQSHPRLTVEEAAPIAIQMAAGLGAAHAVGVLHRDFKPGNVFLVTQSKGTRAVVTDFGLALRSEKDATGAHPVTGTGELLGTPAYMSPEQVEGRELTPASDVYSLGLVLYQMVTGTRAFDSATPLSMAVRRVKEDPPPPRSIVPDLDRRWESVIVRCLARDPNQRLQNGEEVARALQGEPLPHKVLIENRGKKLLIPAVLLILLAAAALFIARISQHLPTGSTPTTTPPLVARPSVAVLPFQNLSGRSDSQWMSTALPEMLTAELAAGGKLRTFPGENIARASSDLGLTGKQTLARDTLAHLHQYLGADYVVLGSYLDQGGSDPQIRVDLWLQDTKTGEIAATISEKGEQGDLDDLATRTGADLRRNLSVGEVTPTEAASIRASLPSNPESARLYTEGLANLRIGEASAAHDLLERAATSDPSFALGHLALADAWAAMGYDVNARAESKKARDLSSELLREERLWIEGRDWELNRKWDKAVESYRTLFEFFPDNIEYGLHLAAAQKSGRSVAEALKTLATLRQLPPPSGTDPRIDMLQAEVLEEKGDYKGERAAADAAARRARDLGAKLLLAHALNQEARSLEEQGLLDSALSTAQEAERIAESAGERNEIARVLTAIGLVRYDQGNFAEAAETDRKALEIQRDIGNERGEATSLNNLANVLGAQGDLAGSTKMLREALAIFKKTGEKHSAAAVLNNIANRVYRQGQLNEGKQLFEQAIAASREIGDQQRVSIAEYNLGEVLHLQGDLKGARKMFEQSRDLSKQLSDESGVGYALSSLGDLLTIEADLAAARDQYNQAIALRNQIQEKGNAAETQMALANVDREEGHAADAEQKIRQARDQFRADGLSDDLVLANAFLAEALLAEGKTSEAQKETTALRELLSKSQDFSVHLQASIATAQVQAAAGSRDQAIRSLAETIANAKKLGYLGLQLESQLALGQIQASSSKPADGVKLLTAVKEQAQQRGFRLIANKASRALAKSSTGAAR